MKEEMKMQKELKENNITDNPFDSMLYFALNLLRQVVFSTYRLKNPTLPEGIQPKLEYLQNNFSEIANNFYVLQNMSEETVRMCSRTSYIYNLDVSDDSLNSTELNNFLFNIENSIPCVYSFSNPCRDETFERIRLGEDSNEFKRLLELKVLVSNPNFFNYKISTEEKLTILSHLAEIINHDTHKYDYNLYMDTTTIDSYRNIIKNYHLTLDDVEYMISYLKWRKEEDD